MTSDWLPMHLKILLSGRTKHESPDHFFWIFIYGGFNVEYSFHAEIV